MEFAPLGTKGAHHVVGVGLGHMSALDIRVVDEVELER